MSGILSRYLVLFLRVKRGLRVTMTHPSASDSMFLKKLLSSDKSDKVNLSFDFPIDSIQFKHKGSESEAEEYDHNQGGWEMDTGGHIPKHTCTHINTYIRVHVPSPCRVYFIRTSSAQEEGCRPGEEGQYHAYANASY